VFRRVPHETSKPVQCQEAERKIKRFSKLPIKAVLPFSGTPKSRSATLSQPLAGSTAN
jgi:hypothetical protein